MHGLGSPDEEAGAGPGVVSALITSVLPSHGPVAGGTTIVLRGAGFQTGCIVRVGGSDARGVTVTGATELEAITPGSDAAGTVDVRFTNSDGTVARLQDGFTYDAASLR